MIEKLTVALLAGGRSSEREVSLKGGEGVYSALDKNRYDIRRYDPATDLGRLAAEAGEIDVAFILLPGIKQVAVIGCNSNLGRDTGISLGKFFYVPYLH